MSTPLHIVSIGYGRRMFSPGDPERARLVRSASKVGSYHHIIFSARSHGLSVARASDNVFLYPTSSLSRLFGVFDAFLIARSLIKKEPHARWVITTQDPLASGVAGFLTRFFSGHPLVVQEHGDIFSGTYWRRESLAHRLWYVVARFITLRANRVRAVSQRVARHLIALGVPPQSIVVLPVLFDAGVLAEQEMGIDAGTPHDRFTVLSAARFVQQKNIPLLLRAFAVLYARVPKALLLLVGEGPERPHIEREIERLNLKEVVELMPWSEDLPALMHRADVFALSSNYEGWGRVLIESMAVGLPVVTTDVGCVGEHFIDGRHGLVVPVGDEDAFASALIRLASGGGRSPEHAHPLESLAPLFERYEERWRDMFDLAVSGGGTMEV